jgi:TrmH family RNA methyltransferase
VAINDKDVRVVLVRPRNPLNIGAAARAMANFGFADLVVVAPYQPTWQESKAAVGAEELLRHARAVAYLCDAIGDRTFVVGTSSLARREILRPAISLDQLGPALKKQRKRTRLALVFGSEKTGLSKDDLGRCHTIVRIPTRIECPSMNLGQAVAVCCYELRNIIGGTNGRYTRPQDAASDADSRASVAEIERLIAGLEKLIWEMPASGPQRARTERLRQMLLRWPVSRKDVTLVLGVVRDVAGRLQRVQRGR